MIFILPSFKWGHRDSNGQAGPSWDPAGGIAHSWWPSLAGHIREPLLGSGVPSAPPSGDLLGKPTTQPALDPRPVTEPIILPAGLIFHSWGAEKGGLGRTPSPWVGNYAVLSA